MSEEMPYASDHFRFFAGAARVLEGKSAGEYMEDHTSWIRREPVGVVGQVTPWNYPLMMMIWKIAPGAGRRQHDRAQALGHHAGVVDAARRAGRRSSCRRACSTSSAATATPAAPWSRTRSRRWSRSPGRSARAWRSPARRPPTSSGCTSSSAARRRSIIFDDADIEGAAAGDRRGGLLQRRPGLHRRDPRARRPRRPRRLRRRPDRGRQGHQDRHARRRGRALRRRSTTRTS